MNKKVLLIADDEEMNRRIISRFLANDFDIIQAVNGKAALDTLRSQQVDALLLDIIMPEMDGLEVLQEMKSDPSLDHVGVLVATSTKEKTERKALSLGADDIVSKPYDPVVIKKRIENIIAVKAISQKEKQLRDDKLGSLTSEKNTDLRMKAEKSAQKVMKYSDMILANNTNYMLVNTLTKDIKEEAENIVRMITDME